MHISDFCSNFAGKISKKGLTMARPIAETPILYGEDAASFMYNMHHVQKISDEEKEKQRKAYEWMKSIATFPI